VIALDGEGFHDPLSILTVNRGGILDHRADELDVFGVKTSKKGTLLNFRDFHDYVFVLFVIVV